MVVLYLGLVGLGVFTAAAAVLGLRLRREPSRELAERLSRVMHGLFFAGLGGPFLVSIFYPGIPQLDGLVGLEPLPMRGVFIALGVIIAIPGLYLFGSSNRLLRSLGSGANAFRLTRLVVAQDVFRHTRNPMSLGYYLLCLSIGFLTGSTLLTLYVLLGVIPAHLFFLKFFEERELALRFGDSYEQYRRSVPFLIPRIGAR